MMDFNVTGDRRKKLVKKLEAITGERGVYMGIRWFQGACLTAEREGLPFQDAQIPGLAPGDRVIVETNISDGS